MADRISVTVSVQPSLADLAKQYDLTPKQVTQIATAAINRTATTVRSRVTKRLADEINLLQKDIRPQVAITNATYEKPEGRVTVSRKPIPLIDFIGTRQVRGPGGGVSVQVRRGGRRELLTGAFIATMRSGHEGVFERRHIAGRNAYGGARFARLPIEERFGLTLTGYLANSPQVVADEQAAAGDALQKNVHSQLQRRLAEKRPTT